MPLKLKTGLVIADQGVQLQRWVEHYLELYATQNIVTDLALVDIVHLPVMVELDATPTKEELEKAIDSLASGKALGSDGIPTEVLKSGKSTLLQHLPLYIAFIDLTKAFDPSAVLDSSNSSRRLAALPNSLQWFPPSVRTCMVQCVLAVRLHLRPSHSAVW